MSRARAVTALVTALVAAGPAGARAPGAAAAADSAGEAIDRYLSDLERRTAEEFALEALSISDAEVDSLLRALEEQGAPAADSPPRWRVRLELGGLRYDRVEGWSVLPGAAVSLPTRFPVELSARAGRAVAAKRTLGRAGWRAGRRTGWRAEAGWGRDVVAYGSGGLPGNTLSSLLAGEDNADYYVAEGWEARIGFRWRGGGVALRASSEQHSSLATAARFTLLRGQRDFRPNPAIDEGTLRLLELELVAGDPAEGRIELRLGVRRGGGALGGDFSFDRLRAELRARRTLWLGDELLFHLSAGAVGGAPPVQVLHHLGGQRTLRGYGVNEFAARSFAHLSLDDALGTDLLGFLPIVRRLRIQLVPFVDAAALFETQERDGSAVRHAPPLWRFDAGIGLQQNPLRLPGGSGRLRLDVALRLDRAKARPTYRFALLLER